MYQNATRAAFDAVDEKKQEKVIAKNVKGIYMQSVIKKKGWSEDYAKKKIEEWLHVRGVSLADFMEVQK